MKEKLMKENTEKAIIKKRLVKRENRCFKDRAFAGRGANFAGFYIQRFVGVCSLNGNRVFDPKVM